MKIKKDKTLSMRLPASVLEALRQAAQQDSRTIAGQALHILRHALGVPA